MAEREENGRLLFFTDGVIAIAITLLVLDIRLPAIPDDATDAEVWSALGSIAPQYFAYFLSFAVLANFWVSHRAKFIHIVRSSNTLIWLNMLFLMAAGLVPFVTGVVAEHDGTPPTVVYAAVIALGSLSLTAIWLHAVRADLIDGIGERRTSRILLVSLLTSGIFIASIPIAFWNPSAAKLFWLLMIPAAMFRGRLTRGSANP